MTHPRSGCVSVTDHGLCSAAIPGELPLATAIFVVTVAAVVSVDAIGATIMTQSIA